MEESRSTLTTSTKSNLYSMMISCFVKTKGDPLKHMADHRCCCWKCCYSLTYYLPTWGKVSLGENPIVFLVLLCLSLCWTPIKFDIVEVALFLSGAKENHLTPIPLPPAGVTVSEIFCKNTTLFHYYYHENEQFFTHSKKGLSLVLLLCMYSQKFQKLVIFWLIYCIFFSF